VVAAERLAGTGGDPAFPVPAHPGRRAAIARAGGPAGRLPGTPAARKRPRTAAT
jgi:hypothetical protein